MQSQTPKPSDAKAPLAEQYSSSDPSSAVRRLTPTSQGAPPDQPWESYALGLGLARVGVAVVDDASLTREAQAKARHAAWVRAGHHAAMAYMAEPRRSPHELLPGARSVIVGMANAEPVTRSTGLQGEVAAYARGRDYHVVVKHKLWQLAQYLCDSAARPLLARVCVDTAPILERFWAEEAGVTFTAKSTMAIAPGVGTTGLLGLLVVDLPLPASPRLPQGCGTCTLCLDACPTGAFPAPFVLDASRCISYLTIESAADIPEAARGAVGSRLFGCDECQAVCPYNASRKRPGVMAELSDRAEPRLARQWLQMTSGDYRRLTKGSALRRAPRAQLQRNAAVVLGNIHPEEEDVAALVAAIRSNASSSVRRHAAWALLRANPTLAQHVLGDECETHPDAELTAEWRRLLNDLRDLAPVSTQEP